MNRISCEPRSSSSNAAGFTVRCAQDGQEAWELIQTSHPDLVITDCQMPLMTGIQLAQRIHETPETSRIPVIMLTGKWFELPHEELRQRFTFWRCSTNRSARETCCAGWNCY